MLKVLSATLLLSLSSGAMAASVIPQVSVMQCRSLVQNAGFGFQAELFSLPTRPEGKPYLLVVTKDTASGPQTTRELAVAIANPRQAGPMHYITATYALDVNFPVSSTPVLTGVLKMAGNNNPDMICITSSKR